MRHLDRETARRIRHAVLQLTSARRGDVKRLRGRGEEYWLRVGRWRVRFNVDAAAATGEVLPVLPRGSTHQD